MWCGKCQADVAAEGEKWAATIAGYSPAAVQATKRLAMFSRRTSEAECAEMEAVRALGQVPALRAAELALVALDRPMDLYLDYALWLTVRELEPHWLPAIHVTFKLKSTPESWRDYLYWNIELDI